MTSRSRWTEVRKIFEEVVELATEMRRTVLDERCGGDEELFAAVNAMLTADEDEVTPALRTAAGQAEFSRVSAAIAKGAAVEIEGFTVKRLIAAGGMGAVYEAEQHRPRRLVALKVLRPELCTGSILQRFRVEAEILGRLQHPGIAEVYAAGVQRTRSGPFELELPWYALELLPSARSLTEHAQSGSLGVRERIDLLRKVCEAIHHAHLRGVIHRDLKPGNILIGSAGEPKIVDFGIARVSDDPESKGLTATGIVLGTPAYMAPEQRRAEPDVDLRCDVFALGVVLYELLTGALPRDPEGGVELAPRAAKPELDREVDWIVGKATASDRSRRYESALDMAEDLARYLRSDTVIAAPPSRIYRLRKIARRHRALIATALVLFVSLSGGLAASLIALSRTRDAEKLAKAEKGKADQLLVENAAALQIAQSEKSKADQLLVENERHLEDVLQKSEIMRGVIQVFRLSIERAVGHAQGRETTIADFCASLDAVVYASDVKGTDLSDHTRGSVANLLGKMSASNGHYREAADYHRRSLELLLDAGLGGTLEEVAARSNLAEILCHLGDLPGAKRELELALALGEKVLQPDDRTYLVCKGHLVYLHVSEKDFASAKRVAAEVLEARTRAFGPLDPETLDARISGANVLYESGDFSGVAAEGQATLALLEQELGADHDKTVNFANLFGGALMKLQRFDEAIEVMEPRVEPARARLAPGHPQLLEMQCTLAFAHLLANVRLDRGIELAADALELRKPRFPPGSREIVRTARLLSRLLLAAGRAAEAVDAIEPHLLSYRDCEPALRANAFESLVAYARALAASDRKPDARTALEVLRADAEAVHGAEDPLRAQALSAVDQWLRWLENGASEKDAGR